ncbi:hypothetical protein U9M48_034510 [Paspalum notatum var. saurae]|uniref:Uncharacterized protein n=1 Tax=Paspalum notatum var. saurae TaxID=547442 RepID=A0AAQ3X736_PASNO
MAYIGVTRRLSGSRPAGFIPTSSNSAPPTRTRRPDPRASPRPTPSPSRPRLGDATPRARCRHPRAVPELLATLSARRRTGGCRLQDAHGESLSLQPVPVLHLHSCAQPCPVHGLG